jgi:Fe-S cluster assembly iron-binding protein IscA
MLMLTPTALEAVRTITSTEGSPEGAGLRIFTAAGAETLQLSVAAAPAEQDQVLAAEGSRIFLDEQAATLLDDKILDTELDQNGNGSFVVLPQGQNTPGQDQNTQGE